MKLLLDSTLDPVLDAAEARNPADPIAGILKLSILDPACGSGHFLLGAARRAAARIAKLRSPGAPSQIEFQHALREVVSRCIYGVDRNPLAVELCKVALWIEALEPGKPLTFLDARIRCGDSLIGVFDYAMLKDGIPDEAYKPLTGDDKDAAQSLGEAQPRPARRQGQGRHARRDPPARGPARCRARHSPACPRTRSSRSPPRRRALARLHAGSWLHLKAACDLYVAAFFAPKTEPPPSTPVQLAHRRPCRSPTTSGAPPPATRSYPAAHRQGRPLAHAVHAFHWPLEFPDILARGGFDVVVGNPPWERIKLQEQEFFAARSPEIAHGAERRRPRPADPGARRGRGRLARAPAPRRLRLRQARGRGRRASSPATPAAFR